MAFNLDIAIFVGFLLVNLAVGLYYGRGVKTIKDYALGGRNFSTATIAATLVATWISGSAFLTDISEVYDNGLFYMIPGMFGDIFSWVLIYFLIAPRTGKFLGSMSVAESMGNIYGQKVRLITAISSTFNCVGKIAAQFKVSATILQLFFGITSFYATLFSSIIVIIYSAFGGIRAVTFTDIVQFFTFGTIIPVIALVIWGTFSNPYIVFETMNENPLFSYETILDYNHSKFWGALSLCIYFIIPSLNPAIFQRISMAKNTKQVADSFSIATFARLIISILFFWVGILLLSHNPNLDSRALFAYIIDNFTFIIGFKGLIAAGIMAMVMSTSDSYINAAAVTFSYDLRKSLGIKWSDKYDLPLSYISSIVIGILAFCLAFYMKGLLSLFLMVSSFYVPIVTVPLLAAIFGFRSSEKSVLIGMTSGLVTVIFWRCYLLDITGVDSVLPGLIANLLTFFISHYLLKQPGGWDKSAHNPELYALKLERKQRKRKFIVSVKNFSLFKFCKANCPKGEGAYSLLGLFSIISVFSTMYSIPQPVQSEYKEILEFVYHTVLISSTVLLTFPIWPPTFKQEKFIIIAWNILVPYILVFAPILLIIVSNFGQFQLMVFLVNIIVIALLLRWQVALIVIGFSTFVSIQFYKWYMEVENINTELGIGLQFKIMYVLLLVSSVLIAFLKPKQEHQELTEEKNEHLSGRINLQEKELQTALGSKQEFIRNVTHEYRTPMTGIVSMAQTLYESYAKLSEEQRLISAEVIYRSALRLENFDANVSILSKLSKEGLVLNKENIDLSNLVFQRVDTCRKLYEDNPEAREFVLNIEEGININADKYYITQTLDNLIINAINYCKKGKIILNLNQDKTGIMFTISDEGIGIPQSELYDIFDDFKVSSKTYTPAGGRGVGLTVAKRVIDAHGGKIWAESDGKNGASFKVVLSS